MASFENPTVARHDPYDNKYNHSCGPYISAYAIAVKHGFRGSEEEWIRSFGNVLVVKMLSVEAVDEKNGTFQCDIGLREIETAVNAGRIIALEFAGQLAWLSKLMPGGWARFAGAPYREGELNCYQEFEILAQGNGAFRTYVIDSNAQGGSVSPEEIETAVDEALEAAKERGEFDGEAGGYYSVEVTQLADNTVRFAFVASKQEMPEIDAVHITMPEGAMGGRGNGILRVNSIPESFDTTTNGKTPIKRMKLTTIRSETGVTEVLVGDQIAYSYYLYHVYYFDDTYAYMDSYVSLRGNKGDKGDPGVYIGSEAPTDPKVSVWIDPNGKGAKTEEWVFELENGEKVTKEVFVSG